MADHSVVARDELHESEASQSLMFCFDNVSPGNSCFVVDLVRFFRLPTRFCVNKCHRNRVESSTAEKVFVFSVSSFASEGKPKRQRQGVHDRRRNIVEVQVGIDHRKCVSDRI